MEFVSLLQLCGFKFTPSTILRILREADTNDDGVIEYNEFLPAMLSIVQGEYEEDADPGYTSQGDWKHIAPKELDIYLHKLFRLGDKNGDGVLQPMVNGHICDAL